MMLSPNARLPRVPYGVEVGERRAVDGSHPTTTLVYENTYLSRWGNAN